MQARSLRRSDPGRTRHNLIWFVTYGKAEAADLTASEKRLLKAAVDEEKRQRAKRPLPRRK